MKRPRFYFFEVSERTEFDDTINKRLRCNNLSIP